jgi:hypothetical protein
MMNKILLRTGIGAIALALGAVGLYGETIVPPLASPHCPDGACAPRRLTNGYYPTTWRKWPVDPPAAEKPGVREGIRVPGVELPPPNIETYLPEGLLTAPPPEAGGGTDDDLGPAPSDTPSTAPPPDRAPPRSEPRPGLPPELRYEPSRFPSNQRSPRRMPTIAGREGNRPAAVIEAMRNQAALHSGDTNAARDLSTVPAALPSDGGKAQPLYPPPAVERLSLIPQDRSVPMPQTVHLDHEPPILRDQPSRRQSRTNWNPARTAHEDRAPSDAAARQPEARGPIASPEQAASRPLTSGLNAPAALYARSVAGDARRGATRADFSISAPASPAVLAVRTASDEGWSPNSQFRNPLRGATAVTKVAFETSETPVEESPVDTANTAARSDVSRDLELPENPLR